MIIDASVASRPAAAFQAQFSLCYPSTTAWEDTALSACRRVQCFITSRGGFFLTLTSFSFPQYAEQGGMVKNYNNYLPPK